MPDDVARSEEGMVEELVTDQPPTVPSDGFPPQDPTITDDILHVSVFTKGPRRA
jgi:hypothetical protein